MNIYEHFYEHLFENLLEHISKHLDLIYIYRMSHNKVYLLNILISQSPNIAQRLSSTRNSGIYIVQLGPSPKPKLWTKAEH